MWTDVVELRDFYATELGQMVQKTVRRKIRGRWSNLSGMRLLGLGFATPYLSPFLPEAERVIAIMPPRQGALPWPEEGPGLTAMADETALPLADQEVDRVLLIHALEATEQVAGMMREIWRVLADGGKMMVVVPNRRGIWARLEHTPFGNGRPYSAGQLERMLRENMFVPLGSSGALFVPPVESRVMLRSAAAMEEMGRRWCESFGGVVMVEAEKRIHAMVPGDPVGSRGRWPLAGCVEGQRP